MELRSLHEASCYSVVWHHDVPYSILKCAPLLVHVLPVVEASCLTALLVVWPPEPQAVAAETGGTGHPAHRVPDPASLSSQAIAVLLRSNGSKQEAGNNREAQCYVSPKTTCHKSHSFCLTRLLDPRRSRCIGRRPNKLRSNCRYIHLSQRPSPPARSTESGSGNSRPGCRKSTAPVPGSRREPVILKTPALSTALHG